MFSLLVLALNFIEQCEHLTSMIVKEAVEFLVKFSIMDAAGRQGEKTVKRTMSSQTNDIAIATTSRDDNKDDHDQAALCEPSIDPSIDALPPVDTTHRRKQRDVHRKQKVNVHNKFSLVDISYISWLAGY